MVKDVEVKVITTPIRLNCSLKTIFLKMFFMNKNNYDIFKNFKKFTFQINLKKSMGVLGYSKHK